MNKYIRYLIVVVSIILWAGFMFGFLGSANSIPENFNPDDLHLACFGVGLCALPFLAGFVVVPSLIGDLIVPLFRKEKQ